MIHEGYEVAPFRPEQKEGVLKVLSLLWGDDAVRNSALLRWKYEQNPYADGVMGIVALDRGRVVGFRGYFAGRYEVPGQSTKVMVLCPGDTCVLPEHRRRGLAVAMGQLALEAFASEYQIFLNMSSNEKALPGYLAMGFVPFGRKAYASSYEYRHLVRFLLGGGKGQRPEYGRSESPDGGWIHLADSPWPQEMARVASRRETTGRKIRLAQDEAFFSWRFGNPSKKYLYYFAGEEDRVTGYVVILPAMKGGRGYVMDYAAVDSRSVSRILRFIEMKRHFLIRSIFGFTVDGAHSAAFRDAGFSDRTLLRSVERRIKKGELPLLVRPVGKELQDEKFVIGNLDVRSVENWQFRGICSDAF